MLLCSAVKIRQTALRGSRYPHAADCKDLTWIHGESYICGIVCCLLSGWRTWEGKEEERYEHEEQKDATDGSTI